MNIVGGPHALRGRTATISRFFNDWIRADIAASGDRPALSRLYRVTDVTLTQAELDRMIVAGEQAGTLWRDFEAQEQVNGMFRLVRRRVGRHRREGGRA